MDSRFLRIHQFLPHSQTNGPGVRAVIWVQGCSLKCPGCFNPETHPLDGGQLVAVNGLYQRIVALGNNIEGITISGGEPLQQHQSLLALLRRVRQETDLSVLIFTGYTMKEVEQMPDAETLLGYIDVLIAGRYVAPQRFARDLRGSANKVLHLLTNRYTIEDLHQVPPAEVIITPEGNVILSGIDPVKW